jgi:N-glycosylase/DNA lyase
MRVSSPDQDLTAATIIAPSTILLPVSNYDLDATLDSGQAFRWQPDHGSWIGVIDRHRVSLTRTREGIRAETGGPVADWQWLRDYLQTDMDLDKVLKTFPDDAPMRAAAAACRGLRLLRQDPWECLASFILSSTKQIVQIRQIIALLCERFGKPINTNLAAADVSRRTLPSQAAGADLRPQPRFGGPGLNRNHLSFCFPTPQRIASLSEAELRACKMGFRAPHLLAAARRIAEGKFDLERLRHLPLVEARGELMAFRGVGDKIADCVLLFAYGFDCAFPVDVWVERALRKLYFPQRRVGDKRLRHFAATHFGPHAGHAQQYLFHYMRTKMK